MKKNRIPIVASVTLSGVLVWLAIWYIPDKAETSCRFESDASVNSVLVTQASATSDRLRLEQEQIQHSQSYPQSFFEKYCIDCHGNGADEGGISLDGLEDFAPRNHGRWKRVWEQVALKEMPPKNGTEQPDASERLQLSNWITSSLEKAMADKGGFCQHRMPEKGNYIDHSLLFGELPDDPTPASTPARLWRIHPQEHLVRLNSLIDVEPEYDPKRPGLRTRGDAIALTRGGELKVFFGLDRIHSWIGGYAAYAAALTGFSPPLSSNKHNGLRSYAEMYSINNAEAVQIQLLGEGIVRFMVKGPNAKAHQFTDSRKDVPRKLRSGKLKGTPDALFYSRTPARPYTPVNEFMQASGISDPLLKKAIRFLFESLTLRPATKAETEKYYSITKKAINALGKEEGLILGLSSIFLDPNALYRSELVGYGRPDEHGRVMLQGHELALAINGAFCYLMPDDQLSEQLAKGRLKTREDVKREVLRYLNDDSIRKPRVLQFFREYFGYNHCKDVCKDNMALESAGGAAQGNGQRYYRSLNYMIASTDRLIELILEEDKDVLKELLTTTRVVTDGMEAELFRNFDLEPRAVSNKKKREREKLKRRLDEQSRGSKKRRRNKKPISEEYEESLYESGVDLTGKKEIYVRISQQVELLGMEGSKKFLASLPSDERLGILTHPTWLIAHSDAMDNHAILRGKWIRERLLGGGVPDVPITVDAMLPDEPEKTLRDRMRVTRNNECWRCHKKMDPLGLPFEMFNHIGLYRETEKGKKVDTSGKIIDSGDPKLDGEVENALDLILKLSESERVEQVFVRHAFRFWIGRNETINDAAILQAAHRAYRDSGGSMKALLVELLTSDAFLYRKVDNTGR